jgi:hypothetical protein
MSIDGPAALRLGVARAVSHGLRLALFVGFATVAAALSTNAARADSVSPLLPVLKLWYDRLGVADATGLAALLTDDATVQLEDLGVAQSKQEFLDSMDEWAASIAGAHIRYRVETIGANSARVLACYDFPSNDVLMREVFHMSDGLISGIVQTQAARSCYVY